MPLFAATILLSAFLLFVVQPILAKQILPWFGGGSAVWAVCLAFFQVGLLAGYTYAHASTRRLTPRRQGVLHLALLVACFAWLPVIPRASLLPTGGTDAEGAILLLLAATVGLPYVVLSATGPLLQNWLAPRFPRRTVYRLFALSNLGSLAGLLAYPFLIEPHTDARVQSQAWSLAFALFTVACGTEAWRLMRGAPGLHAARADPGATVPRAPGPLDLALWLVLAGTASIVLLAGTAHITQNVAAVPFLWVVPLALYLLTFILAFEGRAERAFYARRTTTIAAIVLAVLMSAGLAAEGGVLDVGLTVPLYCAGIFACCLYCHGELALRRPDPAHLTLFYLTVAAGGAMGGVLVGLLAPRWLTYDAELPVALFAVCALAILTASGGPPMRARARIALIACAMIATVAASYYGLVYREFIRHDVIAAKRNFYGTLRVREQGEGSDRVRRLLHGVILHGEQPLEGADRYAPGTYYAPTSGVGRAILAVQARGSQPMRLAVVGLGVGTLSAYARPGDSVRFYEIDPDVVAIAHRYFDFLAHARAPVEIALGDARLSIARELQSAQPPRFDVLAIDAFAGDSIPVHLVTREAVAMYARAIDDAGIIAVHISNRFLDLQPVLANVAADLGLSAALVKDRPEGGGAIAITDWVLIAKRRGVLEAAAFEGQAIALGPDPQRRLWTDQFNDLLDVLKLHPGLELEALGEKLIARLHEFGR